MCIIYCEVLCCSLLTTTTLNGRSSRRCCHRRRRRRLARRRRFVVVEDYGLLPFQTGLGFGTGVKLLWSRMSVLG